MAFFSGTPGGFQQQSRFTPGIQQGIESQIMQLLQGLGNQNYMQDMQGQARKRFEQQTVPGLAERFTSMGEGAQSSGAFKGALGQAGIDLEQQLGGLGLQNQQMQSQLLTSLLGLGGRENVYRPREQSGLEALLPGLFSGGASLLAGNMNPLASLGSLGSFASSYFK